MVIFVLYKHGYFLNLNKKSIVTNCLYMKIVYFKNRGFFFIKLFVTSDILVITNVKGVELNDSIKRIEYFS